MKLRILALLLALLSVFSVIALTGCSESGEKDTGKKETEKDDSKKPTFTDFEGTAWINAADFRFSADGQTPNDKILQYYLKYYDRTPLYFPAGIYCFEETIDFPKAIYIHMDPKAELKCIAKEPIDFFITMQRGADDWNPRDEYIQKAFIEGGTINANYSAKVALALHGGMHTNFENFRIFNVLEIGIQTAVNEFRNGASSFHNIYLYNDKAIPNTIAIYDNTADNQFTGCTAVNFQTCIYTGGGKFTECSGWFNTYGKDLIKDSVYAVVCGGGQSVFNTPLVDTYRTGFQMVPTEAYDGDGNLYYNIPSTSINDLIWITNNTFYTPDLMSQYPMLIFDVPSDLCKIMVCGMYIPWREYGFAFSNIPLPSSSFLNVRYETGWDPWNHMKNFRDDSSRIKAGKNVMSFSDMPSHDAWHAQYKQEMQRLANALSRGK